MKYSIAATALTLSAVQAFPFAALDQLAARGAKPGDGIFRRQSPQSIPPFDAQEQYVSNTGDHAFTAPAPSDNRGPCPGLNAMANHGYFPKNGIGGMSDFVQGTGDAFGMGPDLAEFLAVYGAVFDGNLDVYSIGGPDPSLTNAAGLLGAPGGLSGSHNK